MTSVLAFLFALSRRVFVNLRLALVIPVCWLVLTFLFALSRRVFVNRSSLDGQLTSPVGVTVHTRLRGRICRYRVPVKSKHRGLSASCTPDLGSLVSRTPPAGVTGSGGFAANHAAHWASTRTIPMPLPRKEPMPQ